MGFSPIGEALTLTNKGGQHLGDFGKVLYKSSIEANRLEKALYIS